MTEQCIIVYDRIEQSRRFYYLACHYEFAQWHGDFVLCSDAFECVQSFLLVSRQNIIAGTLRQPLQITWTHTHTLSEVPGVVQKVCFWKQSSRTYKAKDGEDKEWDCGQSE